MGKLTESLEQLNKALSSITDEAESAETGVITPLPPMRANSMSKFFVFYISKKLKYRRLHFILLFENSSFEFKRHQTNCAASSLQGLNGKPSILVDTQVSFTDRTYQMPQRADLLRQYRCVREYQVFDETDPEEIQVKCKKALVLCFTFFCLGTPCTM
jgi:hypothetical protein